MRRAPVEENPCPGGLANGLWKGLPIMPLTTCGTALLGEAVGWRASPLNDVANGVDDGRP